MTTKEFAYAMVMGELNALPPDRRATITQSQIDDALAVTELQANSLAESFKSKEATYDAMCRGRFNTANKLSRQLFESITGIQLGTTNKSAAAALKAYIGQEVIQARTAAKLQELEARQAAERSKRDARHRENLDSIRARVKADQAIDGEDLITLARELNIPLHPRTVGTARRRLVSINSGTARIKVTKSVKSLPEAIWDVYRQAKSLLTQPLSPA